MKHQYFKYLALLSALFLGGCDKTTKPLSEEEIAKAGLEERIGTQVKNLLYFGQNYGGRSYEFIDPNGDLIEFRSEVGRSSSLNILLKGFKIVNYTGSFSRDCIENLHRIYKTNDGKFIHRIGSEFYLSDYGKAICSGKKLQNSN